VPSATLVRVHWERSSTERIKISKYQPVAKSVRGLTFAAVDIQLLML
jgi:hypothetical protein